MTKSAVIIITGGGGFLGQALAASLLEQGSVQTVETSTAPISHILLADIYFPKTLSPALESSSLVSKCQGDVSDKIYVDSLYEKAIPKDRNQQDIHVSVFHLGAVMSGDGERDFDLAMNVNLIGGMNMLQGARAHISPTKGFSSIAKFVFVSAGATIGSGDVTDYVQKEDVIGDSTRATPHTTYGMTKACCELLMTDMSRRNFVDGRGVRLPTIIVRAGTPNGATTGCFSGVIREPLSGIDVDLPIARDVKHAMTGKRSAVDAMIRMHNIEKSKIESILGFDRTVFLPSRALSLGDLEDALYSIVSPTSRDKLGTIHYKVDEFLSNVVGGFPTKMNAERAMALGVPPAPDAEALVRQYAEDFASALVEGIDIISPSGKPTSIHPKSKCSHKVAVVTGGGSGIGRAVSERLAKGGYNVVLAGRRTQTLEETRDLLRQINPQNQYISIPTDVSIDTDVQNLFRKTMESFGRIDLLFNNAGTNAPRANVADVSLDDFERVYKTNVVGPFLCAKEAMKYMKELGGGRIINNGSISAQVPRPQSICYTTSKHAVNGLTKCIALDGREMNIACGQIDFGNVVSDISRATNDPSKGALQANGSYLVEHSMMLKDAAETVFAMANLPLEANVLNMTVIATQMPFVGRG